MPTTLIDRLASASDREAIAGMFADGPLRPFILVDGTAAWPARSKWTLDFFADRFGDRPGIAPRRFGVRGQSGKATLLRAFIKHLDGSYADLPGIWTGADGEPPASDPTAGWSFAWEPFKHDPALFDDIAPFPEAVPNFTAALPRDVFLGLERIHRWDFYSIYISRRGTVTPLHRDRHNLFACLVQFQGRKTVVLYAPDEGGVPGDCGFDPEAPDFERFPEMRGRASFRGVLEPGDMLVIPPNWLHYTRSHDHSITLSHNFFNQVNLADYLRCLIEEAAQDRS